MQSTKFILINNVTSDLTFKHKQSIELYRENMDSLYAK